MHKFTLLTMVLSLSAICGQAQDLDIFPQNSVALQTKERDALWFHTNNAASMALMPVGHIGELDLLYEGGKGDLHNQQSPRSFNDVSVFTQGTAKIGDISLWGEFKFQNNFEKGSRYNTILYEIEEDMPYYAVDTMLSGWNKQAYLAAVKVASPVLWDRVSFGLGFDYGTKVGAKQKDPRCEVYKYELNVYPSVSASFGRHTVGLFGKYQAGFERSEPGNENYHVTQKVFLAKGLGEGILTKVGDNDGLHTCYYSKNGYGGGLQYGYDGSFELMADLGASMRIVDGQQHVELPKSLGRSKRLDFTADIEGLFGSEKQHKVVLDGLFRTTKGIELIQLLNTEAFNQAWETIAENPMSHYKYINARLSYDFEHGKNAAYGYDWTAGAEVCFQSRNYTYSVPEASFDPSAVLACAKGGKQFLFRKSTLLASLKAGYNLGLGGEYIYNNGTKTESIQQMYRDDIVYYTDNYILAGTGISYSFPLKGIHAVIDADVDYATVTSARKDRLTALFKFGIVF